MLGMQFNNTTIKVSGVAALKQRDKAVSYSSSHAGKSERGYRASGRVTALQLLLGTKISCS